MEKQQISKFLKQIYGIYPSFDLYPERIQMWSKFLADMDYDLAIKRLEKHASTSKFAPSIAEILNPEEAKRKKWDDQDGLSPAAVLQGGYKLM